MEVSKGLLAGHIFETSDINSLFDGVNGCFGSAAQKYTRREITGSVYEAKKEESFNGNGLFSGKAFFTQDNNTGCFGGAEEPTRSITGETKAVPLPKTMKIADGLLKYKNFKSSDLKNITTEPMDCFGSKGGFTDGFSTGFNI